jgi:DNA polymerase elongation subunit (family B)
MQKFYTHAMQRGNLILHRGYKNGKRFSEKVPYKPYLIVPSKNGEYRSLVGDQPLSKLIFDSISDAREFQDKYNDVSNFDYHGMNRWVYPFLNDQYPGSLMFDPSCINVAFLDIEVDSEGGFPNIKTANKKITAVTVSNGTWYKAFGLKGYDVESRHKDLQDVEVEYFEFETEPELLTSFLRVWRDCDFDAITGWNVEGFDIPYLWKRYEILWDSDEANKLSPHGSSRKRTYFDKMGRENDAVELHGIATLDYMQLYLKFTYTKQENYSLAYISQQELGETKLDYSKYGTLAELYKQNHQMFIDYNIIDVKRVVQLDKKMKFLELVYAIAYDAKINLEDAITSVLLWDVIIHNKLMERNIVVPKQVHNHKADQIAGAYVKDPRVGAYDWIVSFDLNSLYPHLIMQYNISPETFLGVNSDVNPDVILADDFIPEKYIGGNYTLAGNGAMFDKSRLGIIPELMQSYYDDRKNFKNKQIATEKLLENDKENKELKQLVTYYKNIQMAKKVGLNSAYGALSNEYFRYYNDDLAEAVTLSGQVAIQWAQKHLNDYINKILNNKKIVDYVVASDTDSLLLTMDEFVRRVYNNNLPDELKIVEFLDKVCEEKIQKKIDEFYEELAIRVNAYAQKMQMKREKIASRGLWTGAKRYIMNVWNNEGVQYTEPKFVQVGIESVRSSTPSAARDWIKQGAKVVLTLDQEKLYQYVEGIRAKFDAAPFADIASNSSYNNKKKYALGDKSLPMAVAAGLNYNKLITQLGLEKTKQKLNSGDRIKFARLKMPNPTQENWFGVPVDEANELYGMEKYIDREALWKVGFLTPIETMASAANLNVERKATLDDFFS